MKNATTYYMTALKMAQEMQDKINELVAKRLIGEVCSHQELYDSALTTYFLP